MKDGKIVRFQKNVIEEVRGQVVNFKGHDLIDIRVWVEAKDGSGAIATKKGIALSVEQLPELKRLILALEKVVNK